MLICSYNPAYRSSLKELKPSFRQRFVTVALDYLPPDREAEILVTETGIAPTVAARIVQCATAVRQAGAAHHLEPPSTRTLVTAAHLITDGATEPAAIDACVLGPLTTEDTVLNALREVVAAILPVPMKGAAR